MFKYDSRTTVCFRNYCRLFICSILTLLLLIPFLSPAALAEENSAFVKNHDDSSTLRDNETAPGGLLTGGTGGENEAPLLISSPAFPLDSGDVSEHKLRVNVEIKNSGEEEMRDIRLKMPLLSANDSPYQLLQKEAFSLEPTEVSRNETGTRSALFEVSSLLPGEGETITVKYYFKTSPLTFDFNEQRDEIGQAVKEEDYFNSYLEPSPKIESADPLIVEKAAELTEGLNDDLEKAKRIYGFVLEHMSYDLESEYRNKGALTALTKGSGVCEDFASLFTALSRASGIPARVVNGYTDPAGNGEIWDLDEGEVISLRQYRHSWAEFYLKGWGWTPADPTMDLYARNGNYRYFGSLSSTSHLAQNYGDANLTARYRGGNPSVSWSEELIGDK